MQEGKKSTDEKPDSGWQFHAEEQPLPGHAHEGHTDSVTWSASEFVANEKSAGWYGRLGLAAIAVSFVVYVITRDAISASVMIIVAVLLGIFAARKPRVLQYKVDGGGVRIGEKYYPYHTFRSFAVLDEGAISSIMFMPLKRFMPSLTIYYDPKDEDPILNLVSFYLPFEEKEHDAVDRLMKRIRF